ncbi:hypothetical protein [Mesorhizobium sp. M0618]|uniref:hypothetical protein n=1 Tax=unclassified Mesorhizobium TaxID=325217 RepID=UPI003336C021
MAKPGNLGHQLRASATLAFFIPARRAIRIAQLFSSVHPLSGFTSMMWAGLIERRAHCSIPILLMRPL